jgi:hypothetical protein
MKNCGINAIQGIHILGSYVTHYGLESSDIGLVGKRSMTSALLLLGGANHTLHHKYPQLQSWQLLDSTEANGPYGSYFGMSLIALIPQFFIPFMEKRFN